VRTSGGTTVHELMLNDRIVSNYQVPIVFESVTKILHSSVVLGTTSAAERLLDDTTWILKVISELVVLHRTVQSHNIFDFQERQQVVA